MNPNELELINRRFDDLKLDIQEIKQTLKEGTEHYRLIKIDCNKRMTVLEHFKTRILGITTGISLIVGLLVGRGLS